MCQKIYDFIKYGIKFNFRDTMIILLSIIGLILLFCSCKTTKTSITDKSEINDSTYVKTEITQDSIHTNQTIDETTENTNITNKTTDDKKETIEKELVKDDTKITFGEGGGTFNVITGDATNVADVSISKESEKLKQELTEAKTQLQESQFTIQNLQSSLKETQYKLQSVRDSLANVNRTMDIESEIEETYQTDWYWWLIIGGLAMLVLIVVLRKIPQTSWLLFWI
jgi:hypothetical protein